MVSDLRAMNNLLMLKKKKTTKKQIERSGTSGVNKVRIMLMSMNVQFCFNCIAPVFQLR